MLVEGVGLKAPAPVKVSMMPEEYDVLRDAAAQRAAYRGYARRQDAWGRGFIRDPILVGLVGEYANCKFLSRRGFPCEVDLTLRPYGDGGRDIVVAGLRLEVKTRRKGLGQRSFVKRFDRGRILPIRCDAFVFAEWNDEPPIHCPLLLGWIWAPAARRECFERSPIAKASHWNLKVRDVALLPMSRFIDELHARERCA